MRDWKYSGPSMLRIYIAAAGYRVNSVLVVVDLQMSLHLNDLVRADCCQGFCSPSFWRSAQSAE